VDNNATFGPDVPKSIARMNLSAMMVSGDDSTTKETGRVFHAA